MDPFTMMMIGSAISGGLGAAGVGAKKGKQSWIDLLDPEAKAMRQRQVGDIGSAISLANQLYGGDYAADITRGEEIGSARMADWLKDFTPQMEAQLSDIIAGKTPTSAMEAWGEEVAPFHRAEFEEHALPLILEQYAGGDRLFGTERQTGMTKAIQDFQRWMSTQQYGAGQQSIQNILQGLGTAYQYPQAVGGAMDVAARPREIEQGGIDRELQDFMARRPDLAQVLGVQQRFVETPTRALSMTPGTPSPFTGLAGSLAGAAGGIGQAGMLSQILGGGMTGSPTLPGSNFGQGAGGAYDPNRFSLSGTGSGSYFAGRTPSGAHRTSFRSG